MYPFSRTAAKDCAESESHLRLLLFNPQGNLPNWLKGTFLRVGPGKWDLGDFTLNHWLDGYAILYKFDIRDGTVYFTKKYLQSDAYKKATACQRPIFTEFGTRAFPDPCKNIFSRMMSTLSPSNLTDNAIANVFECHDEVYASSETCFVRKIDPKTLDTKDKVDYHKAVSVNLASSHPLSSKDGFVYNLGSSFISSIKYHIIQIPPAGKKGADMLKGAKIHCSIPSRWHGLFSYYHSFGMTESYFVFIEQPFVIHSTSLITSQIKGSTFRDSMEWRPQEMNKFIVIDKETGKQVKIDYFSNEPFFLFHHINTFESGDQLVVDVIAYKTSEILDKFYLTKLREGNFSSSDPGHFRRYVLPLIKDIKGVESGKNLVTYKDCKAKAEKEEDRIIVTPERMNCDEGQYARGIIDQLDDSEVIKIDTVDKKIVRWNQENNTSIYPGEPKFVPAPNGVKEDDGVVLATCTDVRQVESRSGTPISSNRKIEMSRSNFYSCNRKGTKDFLVVLNASTMKEMARCEVDANIPGGVHGLFLA
ncbi:unnamed protein product [Cyprideis torosa]|uniref:Uncharacterized protein n=1 Tax=Cyprideis torosa TaxID=163714 RepID=A0A7R8ZHV7_9CRUS|nr:unnamed protein product [Cyprideis torosa]CAG0883383.1 unnamed protein product [Cyprideis torosa]